ncbi:neuronal acetylcholine receptor subunit alpha-7-like [Tropilaelaps mercedesae]|uniref:Neuronal acetylcholine receptor subunit alpha-7-like n=1 Tax=Tropilaelaps mercedesae TaxID=418985 RepID=A0A1V9X437_9ACAR|nr:neuronal acetylcholine receptor subunit alpha-7-like [Tropilaelaps mercedesae]
MTLRRRACHHVVEHVLPLIAVLTLGLLTMMIPVTRADIRLLVITLLLGSLLLHLRLTDSSVPESMSVLTLLSGQFVLVLSSLFLCNCIHLAILRGHMDCSFLAKLSTLIGSTPDSADKSEALISDVEQRCHCALDSVFTWPLAFITVLSTALFLSIPLF